MFSDIRALKIAVCLKRKSHGRQVQLLLIRIFDSEDKNKVKLQPIRNFGVTQFRDDAC